MVRRKIIIKESVVESIAAISWFIESEGFPATAEKFADNVYDFIELLADERKRYKTCREPERALMGYKCINYKKYTIVILELDAEIMICEFIPSKMINW
ncbi:type II toxin-antitoxin system RelE/ParE family toxin [Pedobacter aquatilis]|uniref:type II toxin-antitoxin system RelE/ParE family toxin n=1 Tax=Pedobacter aquatilis TaxID=351343 RepID=UPI0029316D75|nr:type II toxin-antitoxin system RelE/ParE family toxin [Pedobacter aquatilis]